MDENTPRRPGSIGVRLIEALAWGVTGALTSAIAAMVGLQLGRKWYPQRYAQMPVEIFLIPLAFVIGFVTAATVRLARPRWTLRAMGLVVLVVALLFGRLSVHSTKEWAEVAELNMTLLPEQRIQAVVCSAARCPPSTPEWEWMIEGRVLVRENRTRVGGRVDAIAISGRERIGKRDVLVNMVKYTAEQIRQQAGTNRLDGGGSLEIPIQFPYRTTNGSPTLGVSVVVHFTDSSGHFIGRAESWRVQ